MLNSAHACWTIGEISAYSMCDIDGKRWCSIWKFIPPISWVTRGLPLLKLPLCRTYVRVRGIHSQNQGHYVSG